MGGTCDEKTVRRFFTPLIDTVRGVATIEKEEFRHLKGVLRLETGCRVRVFDGRGREFTGTIEELSRLSALVRLEEEVENTTESPLEITLLQALLKGDKNALVVQKATELGVKRIVLFTTERTLPDLTAEKTERLRERLEKVSMESLKQCGRTSVPEILIKGFKEALVAGGSVPLKLLFHERATGSLKEVLTGHHTCRALTLGVGPEGGFSQEEVALAEKMGYLAVRCAPRVLRAETTGIVATALLQYALGDMG